MISWERRRSLGQHHQHQQRKWSFLPRNVMSLLIVSLGAYMVGHQSCWQDYSSAATTSLTNTRSTKTTQQQQQQQASSSLLRAREESSRPAVVESANLACLEVFQNDKTMISINADTEPEKCLLRSKPSRYIRLLMDISVGLPRAGRCAEGTPGGKPYCTEHRPYNAHQRQFGLDHPPDGYTMVGKQRLENFRAAIQECLHNDILGSIVELGVWRGGAMLFAAGVLKEYQEQHSNENVPARDLYLFDAYESIDSYGDALRPYLSVSEQQVREVFEYHDLMDEHVHFVKGMFQDTVPSFMKEQHQGRPIAVLRVDGNFYDSYQDSMYHFYSTVPVGGIIIFDDVFTHKPVMQFWNDFKADQGLPEELVRIDTHSGWFRKTKDVTIDWSKFREPQDANKKQE